MGTYQELNCEKGCIDITKALYYCDEIVAWMLDFLRSIWRLRGISAMATNVVPFKQLVEYLMLGTTGSSARRVRPPTYYG